MAASKRFELRLQAPEAPELVQACALALQVLKVAKVETWHDLALAIQASNVEVLVNLGSLEISPAQQALIRRHEPVLCSLQNRVKDTRTIAVCPECGGWFWTQSRVPSKCQIGWQCTGKPIRATATAFKKVPLADDADPTPALAEPDEAPAEDDPVVEDRPVTPPQRRRHDDDPYADDRPDDPEPPEDDHWDDGPPDIEEGTAW